jgi:hypothetical protein
MILHTVRRLMTVTSCKTMIIKFCKRMIVHPDDLWCPLTSSRSALDIGHMYIWALTYGEIAREPVLTPHFGNTGNSRPRVPPCLFAESHDLHYARWFNERSAAARRWNYEAHVSDTVASRGALPNQSWWHRCPRHQHRCWRRYRRLGCHFQPS